MVLPIGKNKKLVNNRKISKKKIEIQQESFYNRMR